MILVNVKNEKKYGKLSDNLSEEIPWNKLCVDIIGPYVIRRKCNKENLHLKAVMIIDSVTGWFEIAQYEDRRAISTANLVETTWMYRYPRLIRSTYDKGKEFIGHEFRISLIEMECGITAKPSTSENPMFKAVLEIIQQVLGNLVRTFKISTKTCVGKDNRCTGILGAAAF